MDNITDRHTKPTAYVADDGTQVGEREITEWSRQADRIDAGERVDAITVRPFTGRPWERRTTDTGRG